MSGRILIVDDVASNRALLGHLLQSAYYEVEEAQSGGEALEMALRDPPDLALVDVLMPGIDGYELCRQFKANPKLADVPVVIVTTLETADDRREGLEAGADDFLTKPVRQVALMARLRSLLRMKSMTDELRLRDETVRDLGGDHVTAALIEPKPSANVLCVSSAERGEQLRTVLMNRLDVTVELAADPATCLRMIGTHQPEAVIVDTCALDASCPDFITALRQRPETRGTALLTVVEADAFKLAAKTLDAGANDYVMEPLDPSELCARLRTQLRYKAYADHLRETMQDGLRLAATDPLTGLRNRRYVDTHLPRMIQNAVMHDTALSVLVFDLDRFKSINDTHGHPAGDAVLQEFARRVLDNTRSVDLVARLGGEEFLVAMPDAALKDAEYAGERIRAAVEAPDFAHEGGAISVTVSVGVAALRKDIDTDASLIARADTALYSAKTSGRNRVILSAA